MAGATLTSYAIAESIQQRLAGAAPSLRFPEPVTLAEVRGLFTNATHVVADGQKWRVFDAGKQLLGYAIRTSPQADNVGGYRGPTEALVALGPDARTITAVRVRSSYDTTSYVDQVRNDGYYLKLFQGRTLEQLAAMDFKKEKIEGVSGATQTSYAVAEGLKRRAAAELRFREGIAAWKPRARDYGLAAVMAGACVMAFTSLRGKRLVRFAWQCLLIIYVGLINGDLLSLALLGGWMTSSVALKAVPGLVAARGCCIRGAVVFAPATLLSSDLPAWRRAGVARKLEKTTCRNTERNCHRPRPPSPLSPGARAWAPARGAARLRNDRGVDRLAVGSGRSGSV